jgi:hypothetical protein
MKRLLSAIETVAAGFLLLIALLTASNVLLRDLFSVQIPDWYDGSRLIQGIALFWGVALATYYGSHICVDIVWEHLKPHNRRRLDLAATTVTLAFLLPFAWMLWQKVGSTGSQRPAPAAGAFLCRRRRRRAGRRAAGRAAHLPALARARRGTGTRAARTEAFRNAEWIVTWSPCWALD